MVLLSVLALVLLAATVVLVLRAAALPRLQSEQRIKAIRYYGFTAPAPTGTVAGPALSDLAGRLGASAARRVGAGRTDALRRQLVAAGLYRLSPAAFLGYQVLGLAAAGTFAAVLGSASSPQLGAVYGLLGAAFGWYLPVGWLGRTGRLRAERIDRELPDVLDLVVITVEAGLTLSASLQIAAAKSSGPLADELRVTLQEQRMGRSLHDALLGMLGRCDTPNMRSFVRSVTQGETLGVSIGTIMHDLAIEMRKRRRAAAEKQAQKAPVKILFPLVFLILPAFVLILLAPPVIQLFESFGK